LGDKVWFSLIFVLIKFKKNNYEGVARKPPTTPNRVVGKRESKDREKESWVRGSDRETNGDGELRER
jgi:hypothetical protein